MGRFHSNNGLNFERKPDGSVTVSHWLYGLANSGRETDQAPVEVLDRSWKLTASEWASVVATVSQHGETGETWRQALDFHGEESSA